MDIHLPKVPHSWRELAREIGIIVLGVLIALFFEELVQAWDWRQKVRAADQAMRTEILSDDGPELYNAAVLHPCVVRQLNAIRLAVESHQPRAQVRGLIDGLWIPFVTYDSTAYTTTEASQVVTGGMLFANMVIIGTMLTRAIPAWNDWWFYFNFIGYLIALAGLVVSRSRRLDYIFLAWAIGINVAAGANLLHKFPLWSPPRDRPFAVVDPRQTPASAFQPFATLAA